jgi:hypothetical protein
MAGGRGGRKPIGGGGVGGGGVGAGVILPHLSTGDLIRFVIPPPHVPFPTYVMEGGKRRNILSQQVFDEYGFDPNSIQTLNILPSNIPQGSPLSLNEIGILVVQKGQPATFFVMLLGTISRVPDQVTVDAIRTSRANADKLVLTRTAPPAEFSALPRGEDLVSLASGGLFQDYDERDPRADPTPHIGNLYIADGTHMRLIPDQQTFDLLGLSLGNFVATDEFTGLRLLGLVGPNSPSASDDNVYRGPDGSVFLMQGGQRHLIPDQQTLNALDATVQSISSSEINSFPRGQDLAPIHIDHVVVLMLENRSFDHILGDLAKLNPAVNGIPDGATFSNPQDPTDPNNQTIFPVQPTADYITPLDPGHELANSNNELSPVPSTKDQRGGAGQPFRSNLTNSGFVYDYQLVIDAANNSGIAAESVMNYFSGAKLPKLTALAQGFAVCDAWFASVPGPTMPNRFFVHAGTAAGYAKSPFQDTRPSPLSLLVDFLTMLPAGALTDPLSLLKDPNQIESFILDVLKANYIKSDPESALLFNGVTNTIYELLEANGKSWALYFHDLTEAVFIPWMRNRFMNELSVPFDDEGLPTAPSPMMNGTGNFRTFRKFLENAKAGTLPFYSFVSPRFGHSPELQPIFDALAAKITAIATEESGGGAAGAAAEEAEDLVGEDPPLGIQDLLQLVPLVTTLQPGSDGHPPNDVRDCEHLIAQVYNALKSSPNWEKTVLIVLFDEYGGFYDHVVPPAAVNTDPLGRVYDSNTPGFRTIDPTFAFNRLGPRVPAIIISPFIAWSTVDHHVYDHTSILSAVVSLAEIPGKPYPHRVPQALSFFRSLTLAAARTGGDLPAL